MAARDGILLIDLQKNGRTEGNRWWARLWDRRRRRYTMSRTFGTKDEARRWAIEQRAAMDKGAYQATTTSLAVLGAEWLTEMGRLQRHWTHLSRAKQALRQLAEAGIDDMTNRHFASDIAHWLQHLKAVAVNPSGRRRRTTKLELSNATKNRQLSVIKTIIHFGMKRGYLAIDPLRSIGLLTETRRVKAVFSVADLRHLLDDRFQEDPYWLLFALMTYTGMRVGEAQHLRWEWIDFSSGMVFLRSHADFPLKTDEERVVPLQPELAAILLPRRQSSGWIIADDGLRSCTELKTRWNAFRRFLIRCQIPVNSRSPHSTRHTWVAMMLATGTNVLDVKEWAGHRQLTTSERYARERSSYRTSVSGWRPGIFNLREQVVDTSAAQKMSAKALAADDQVVYESPSTWASSIARPQLDGSPSGERDQTVG